MGQRIAVVDAFADRPFAGNPAAVCVLPEEREVAWMQLVARELNLSETAFLVCREDEWSLRWFTPTTEVDLCGHATLASAHVLWEEGVLAETEVARFHTRGGLLTAALRGEGIEMDFPSTPDSPAPEPDGLSSALGASPSYIGRTRFDTFVELKSEAAVRGLRPDMRRLAMLGRRGVIVTAAARGRSGTAGYDFVSRFFAPGTGVDEDPVTGSAHCALGPHWAERLGKTALVGYQCSARGGMVRVDVRGDRVLLGGRAITMMRGELVGG